MIGWLTVLFAIGAILPGWLRWWWRYGADRRYVDASENCPIGLLDLFSRERLLELATHADRVARAVEEWGRTQRAGQLSTFVPVVHEVLGAAAGSPARFHPVPDSLASSPEAGERLASAG